MQSLCGWGWAWVVAAHPEGVDCVCVYMCVGSGWVLCFCVCMCVRVWVCTWECVCICMWMYCACVCLCAVFVCVCVCVHMCMRVCLWVWEGRPHTVLTWVPLSSTVGTGAVGGEYMLCGGTLPQIPLTVLTCHSLCFRQHCGHWGSWWRVQAVWWNPTTNTPRC